MCCLARPRYSVLCPVPYSAGHGFATLKKKPIFYYLDFKTDSEGCTGTYHLVHPTDWCVPPTSASPYIYILKSLHYHFIYVGFTKDLKKRFKQHNNKEELSTKAYAPFELIHYEAYRNMEDAKRREKYFKTTKGKTTVRYMLKEYLQASK